MFDQLHAKIDSLAGQGLPKSALAEVEKLDQLARQRKNVPQQVRATIYRITFISYLEEDAIVKVVHQLKTDVAAATFPLKPVLQSLLADMYWNYYRQNRYRFNERSRLATPDDDFTNWDLHTLLQEVAQQHQLALQHEKQLQITQVGVLEGVLAGDVANRYLRPTLYDLLLHRALEFFLAGEATLLKPKEPYTLNDPALYSDSRTFANLPLTTTDTTSLLYQGLKLLQQATKFHLQAQNRAALADLDLKRLQAVHRHAVVPGKDARYEQSLQQLAADFSTEPISADALVLLGQHYQQQDSLAQAMRWFREAQERHPNSLGGQNAAKSIQEITQQQLEGELEDVVAPGKAVLVSLEYRNVTEVSAKLFKITEAQLGQLQELLQKRLTDSRTGRTGPPSGDILALLNRQPPVQEHRHHLTGTEDYRRHRTELLLEPLQSGFYALLLQEPNTTDTALYQLGTFRVTPLSYVSRVNPDGQVELRVLHRDTGEPLAGVQVKVSYIARYEASKADQTYTALATTASDRDGKVVFSKRKQIYNVRITLTSGTETFTEDNNHFWGPTLDRVPQDEAEEKTILFTDRQIYRPGQTIYFKGMQLKTLQNKSSLVVGQEVDVELLDGNDETLGELALKTNEFGTFSGTFVLPSSVLPGVVRLETPDGQLAVRVEEYKRPTFELTFAPYKDKPKLNDSVRVHGQVQAFAGYGLSQAQLSYTVTRHPYQPWQYWQYDYRIFPRQEPVMIQTGTLITKSDGSFEVKFKASVDDVAPQEGQVFVYKLEVSATDASGETQQNTLEIKAGNKPLLLMARLPDKLLAQEKLKGTVSLSNLNGQLQPGKIQVGVYALQQPEQVHKHRLWQAPDKPLLSKETYRSSFPAYGYPGAAAWQQWPRQEKVLEQTVQTTSEKPTELLLELPDDQAAGVYLVQLYGFNEHGDSTSHTQFFTYINPQQNKPVRMEEWVMPVKTTGKAGEEAVFLVGTGTPGHVLMEVYEGATKVSATWVRTGEYQVRKTVPLRAGDKAQRVQFLLVQDNRSYRSYQQVYVQEEQEKLDVKFTTFRDVLQPGQREEWKIRIRDAAGKKEAAELVATLYDASLDKFVPDRYWPGSFGTGYHYVPEYFSWNTGQFVQGSQLRALQYRQYSFGHASRDYEHLNLFGYNYYGGYNYLYQQYLRQVEARQRSAENDKRLEEEYQRNAEKIKEGLGVKGRVVGPDGEALPGVTIQLKGTTISTHSNSRGAFRFKVPAGGVLMFQFIGYLPKEVKIQKAGDLVVKLARDTKALEEVVVVGYAVQKRDAETGAVEAVGGVELQEAAAPPVAEAMLGSVAGMDTEEESANAAPAAQPVRRNFQETAFFYPHLRTNKNGDILLEFTVPDALTRWKFKGLAHTQQLKLGYLEQEVVTQKELMVSAHMPRFFREGDTIRVTARLANLTGKEQRGKVQLELFNALNRQPVQLLTVPSEAQQPFTLAPETNQAVAFTIAIPAGLEAITYRITAETSRFSDGEENTLPVLPNAMLVTESLPLLVRPGQQKVFSFDKLLSSGSSATLRHKALTLEYTPHPVWYAVQALPYLMEFPYECSEQVFSRYFANRLAGTIVQKQPVIQEVFAKWQEAGSGALLSNLEKNPELKAVLLEETPWLRDAVSEQEQKKRIALLFDLHKLKAEEQANLQKLADMQLVDGSFPWFRGNYPDRFITQHILAGIGQLLHLQVIDGKEPVLEKITRKGWNYLEHQLQEEAKRQKQNKSYHLNALQLHAWYARSYYTATPLSAHMQALWKEYQELAATEWKFRSIHEQGMIALTMHRFGQAQVARQIIASLLETATRSDELGMYWHQNKGGYFWYQAPVETQVLLVELFTEAKAAQAEVEEMKIWLLQNKRTNNWRTTKATVAACYALLLQGENWLAPATTATPAIRLANQPLASLKPGLAAEAGTGYIKTSWAEDEIAPAMGKVEVKSNSSTVSWGALHWQYLEQLDNITSSDTNIKLQRQYFIETQTEAGKILTEVDATHLPKVGDVLKVVVYLAADRDFEYVHLKDKRPAGTEPLDVLSEYKYQDGLYYYQTTKDVATNFFLSGLPKGNFVFEYRLRVAHAGEFSTGISSVQCMYAPEFNAHSEGQRLRYVK